MKQALLLNRWSITEHKMEFKWVAIMAMVSFVALFAAIGVVEYSKGQCKIEAIRAGLTPEFVVKACGK